MSGYPSRRAVVSIGEGSAEVQGSRDPTPTTVAVGTPFSCENRRFSPLSATDGVAVFRYHR